VTGVCYGYADALQTKPTYAYLAGDITPAYDGATVSEVTRRFLTVFDTGNADVPMILFVFDRITANDPTFKKTFLLHVPAEPKLDGHTVSVERGEGKLVLQSVFGCDLIKKIGGTGKNYVVNGQQLAPCKNGDDGFWGRVEISPNPGRATDDLLNVMFVCDADDTPALPALPVETDVVKGAFVGDVAALFVRNADRRAEPFSVPLPGKGEYTVYLAGVAAGNWSVTLDGIAVASATAAEDGGLLVFRAPAGDLSLSRVG
jgi:heparin/heparan-sulfate lyase